MTSDRHNLQRFVQAQDPVFTRVLSELESGRKTSHWMWFVFPQVVGLGASAMSQRYAISSLEEAKAYLEHPVLGPRLQECVKMLLGLDAGSAHDIFRSPDDRKLHSSLTLFSRAAPGEAVFHEALDRFFDATPDRATLERL